MSSAGFGTNGLRRGALAGVSALAVLALAAVPSRAMVAMRGWGAVSTRLERAVAGALLDLSAVVALAAPVVLLSTLLVPLVLRRARTSRWQREGAVAASLPVGFALWVMTVMAQEVKSERGSFPTVFDLLEGGTNASFLEGTLGYARYERIWMPAVAAIVALAVAAWVLLRRPPGAPGRWGPWALGATGGLGGGALGVVVLAAGLASADNRFSPAALGDPLTGLVESSFDVLQHRGPATPRQLVLDADLPPEALAVGASRMGWPARHEGPHPWSRPLDPAAEPMTRDPRGRRLVEALQRASAALFADGDGNVAVFQLALEGFRADDVHALNPAAPRDVAPFTSSLYESGSPGVLASTKTFQAGVRTAHGLGAMTCGLGTLPYNLAFIRDLQPFPVRCLPDVLADAGFRHSFFYGSDATFDEMARFFREHRYETVVGQAELPTTLPKGTWEGITDFAVFDVAVTQVAEALPRGPQFSMLMSLSNHSPFTPPEDLPRAVEERVDRALATAVNRADADDRRRLVAYSYTDAAVERFFGRLDELGLASRSLVVMMADHSTGHAYVWGEKDPETDAAKSQVPFVVVVPEAFLARVARRQEAEAALAEARALLEEAPLSQNDLPTLLLALLSAHPGLEALPPEQRWHTLGGQVTSPWFDPGGDGATSLLGINGVSELYALDREGRRIGGYEDSVFLKTRADRYRVTPRLIPVTATLQAAMRLP